MRRIAFPPLPTHVRGILEHFVNVGWCGVQCEAMGALDGFSKHLCMLLFQQARTLYHQGIVRTMMLKLPLSSTLPESAARATWCEQQHTHHYSTTLTFCCKHDSIACLCPLLHHHDTFFGIQFLCHLGKVSCREQGHLRGEGESVSTCKCSLTRHSPASNCSSSALHTVTPLVVHDISTSCHYYYYYHRLHGRPWWQKHLPW